VLGGGLHVLVVWLKQKDLAWDLRLTKFESGKAVCRANDRDMSTKKAPSRIMSFLLVDTIAC
jgi:hypothetical protein